MGPAPPFEDDQYPGKRRILAQPLRAPAQRRLGVHPRFARADRARARIFMCADCRVTDLYSEEKPLDIRDMPR